MIRAFTLAIGQLGDPRLRGVIWQSLALALVLQAMLGGLAWWALQSSATFEWQWVNQGPCVASMSSTSRTASNSDAGKSSMSPPMSQLA